jgi:N-acetylneuraminate lyase
VAAIAKQAAFERECGVDAVWVVGGCGQWATLSTEERMQLAQAWVEQGRIHKLFVIVHVGSNSLEQACVLAAHAAAIGADAICAYPPFSPHRPATLSALILCLKTIVAAAPSLPFYYYHIPVVTGVNMKMISLLHAAKTDLPQLQGVKYVGWDLDDFAACVAFDNRRYRMMWANNPKLSACFTTCDSWVLAQSYLAPSLRTLLQTYRNETEARTPVGECKYLKMSGYIAQLLQLLHGDEYGGEQIAAKHLFRLYSIDLGDPRLPLTGLSEDRQRELFTKVQTLTAAAEKDLPGFKLLPPMKLSQM